MDRLLKRLMRACLSRKHSPEYAEHVLRIKRAIERMPPGMATEAWCAWLWKLPPQAWLEAVDLRILTKTERELRESGVRAITRIRRLSNTAPGSPEAIDAAREVETVKEESRKRTLELMERRRHFAAKWGEPPGDG